MLPELLAALRCPVCAAQLAQDTVVGTLSCSAGHSFDVAREGYVNLLPGRAKASTADTPAMVAARVEFLARGHFARLYDAVAEAARAAADPQTPGIVLDAGGGTGELLARVLDALPTRCGLALDISKHAARRAARIHERAGAIVADTWTALPIRDASAALVLCAFAPRNATEFARVLAPGGALVVVVPTAAHLGELVGPLGLLTVDPQKDERLSATLDPRFERVAEQLVEYRIALSHADALSAAEMGPSAAHASVGEFADRVATLPEPFGLTVSARVLTYGPCEGATTPAS